MIPLRVDVDFDALSHLICDGIAFIGGDERVVAWSETAAGITGVGAIQAVGKTLADIFADVDPPLEFAVVPQRLKLWTRDETRRSLHATVLSIEDGWLLSFGHQQRFAQIDQLKSEIVASVSHELKTPIATIKAFATTLRENREAMASSRDEYLRTIEEEADRLSYAVDDLLTAGRVDVEHLPEHRERVELDIVLDAALERLDYSSRQRLTRSTGGVTIFADAQLLGLAIAHVIENALKFSGDTSPVIVEADAAEDSTVVRVIDRGIGIAEEHMPYVFERFYRGDARLTATAGGSGLGLYVARSVLRAHGGSIAIESTPGSGSTVTLRVPARA
ncbi:MAG TPA: ATP-binding protein [Candidatus Baltobacteraceae bacterium]|jgi:signal transduction histidine kinase|nr:ATP-binding protein [Candidatus Baltobacteraceae bacterium]